MDRAETDTGPRDDKIKVMIVDDHPVVRIGLETMLNGEEGIRVVATAGSAREALAQLDRVTPDVVLMDLRMPEMEGTEAIAAMRRVDPGLGVLVLTNYQEDAYIVRAFEAGAMGYLLKCSPQEQIVSAVHAIHQHRRYVPDEITQRLLETVGREQLSERELEVLALAARGLSNKQIAQKLFISDKTARNHIANCLFKLEAGDRTEAATKAIQRGLIRI